MDFSLMFFAASDGKSATEQYELVLDLSRYAEKIGCRAVWVPERHFDPFGEAFPNPLILLSAIAAQTTRIALRAGSIVAPLHDTVRIFEDWSMLDNLSRGRCALSFGSGWNANDFIFAPDRFECRREYMWQQISEVLRYWGGEVVVRANGAGEVAELAPGPRPFVRQPSIWVTNSGNRETTIKAARSGASILTHLLGKSLDEISAIVDLYRASEPDIGGTGQVSLMLHTCVSDDEVVQARARTALRNYLRMSIRLENRAAVAAGSVSGGHRGIPQDTDSPIMDELLDISTEKTLQTSLIGSLDKCRDVISNVADIGVDEICCLVDFGLSREDIFYSLDQLKNEI